MNRVFEAYQFVSLDRRGRPESEIITVMIATAGIEMLVAAWTAEVALHVLVDGQFRAAGTTENCFLVPLASRPDFNRMIGESFVTILAGVVDTTTFHFDGDDVREAVIVLAAGLRVKIDAAHV
jgi:hypothetical protein